MKSRRTLLAWRRDAKNDWMSELRDGEKPETLRNVIVDVGAVKARSAQVYDPWANRWSKASVKGGKAGWPAFSRSIAIRID